MSGAIEFERDQAQRRGEGTAAAPIGDVEDLAAVGAAPGTGVASETLPEVGCRATKAVRQADPGGPSGLEAVRRTMFCKNGGQ